MRGFCTCVLFQYWDLNSNPSHPPLLHFTYIIKNVLTTFGRAQLASEQTLLVNTHRFTSASSRLSYCLRLLHVLSTMSWTYFSEFLILSGCLFCNHWEKIQALYVCIYIYINPAVVPDRLLM